MAGTGVTILNETLVCSNGGAAIFNGGGTTNIGINSGIILSTGDANVAIGPNDDFNAGVIGFPNNTDSDLEQIAGVSINDACILEFDFIPVSSTISFQYVFGSEEYNEFVCSAFNDAFGFFVSGPGINGPFSNNAINIALLPDGVTPVTINTVNIGTPGTNPQVDPDDCPTGGLGNNAFFVNNPEGANTTIQFDGQSLIHI